MFHLKHLNDHISGLPIGGWRAKAIVLSDKLACLIYDVHE
jgi:hypothetical protein